MAWVEASGWICLLHGHFEKTGAGTAAHIDAQGTCKLVQVFRTAASGPIPDGDDVGFVTSGSSGIVYKEVDPASQTFVVGDTVLVDYDVGALSQLIVHGCTLPRNIVNNLYMLMRVTFSDASHIDVTNNSGAAVTFTGDALDAQLLTAATHRKTIQRIQLVAHNGLLVPTLGNFLLSNFRAYASPVGNATLPA